MDLILELQVAERGDFLNDEGEILIRDFVLILPCIILTQEGLVCLALKGGLLMA